MHVIYPNLKNISIVSTFYMVHTTKAASARLQLTGHLQQESWMCQFQSIETLIHPNGFYIMKRTKWMDEEYILLWHVPKPKLKNSILRIFTSRLLAVATKSTFSFHCHENDMNLTERCRHSDGNLCLLGHLEIDTKYPESPDMLFPQKLPNNISAWLSACDGKYPHKLPNCLGIFSSPIIYHSWHSTNSSKYAMVTHHNIQPDNLVIHIYDVEIYFNSKVGWAGKEQKMEVDTDSSHMISILIEWWILRMIYVRSLSWPNQLIKSICVTRM